MKLQTASKTSSHHMASVTKTMNGGWKLRVQALLEVVDNNPPEKIRPCDLQKLINSLKWKKPAKLMAFQMNASCTFQGDRWFI
jgi:hypothetical protein